MLDYFEEYRDELRDVVTDNLSRFLEPPLNSDVRALGILSQRFMNCFTYRKLPSERILFLYHFGIDLDKMDEGYSLHELIEDQPIHASSITFDEIARSCEFYGGLFPKRMQHRSSSLNEGVLHSILGGAYHQMVRIVDAPQRSTYDACSRQPENVLFAFRCSTARFPWS